LSALLVGATVMLPRESPRAHDAAGRTTTSEVPDEVQEP
jgi:hypothetical protein